MFLRRRGWLHVVRVADLRTVDGSRRVLFLTDAQLWTVMKFRNRMSYNESYLRGAEGVHPYFLRRNGEVCALFTLRKCSP